MRGRPHPIEREVMAVCTPYHSLEPQAGDIYHNNTGCPVGQRIAGPYRRDGIGTGRSLCEDCVQLDLNVWFDRPGAEEKEESLD
jgi:hypothetical protein